MTATLEATAPRTHADAGPPSRRPVTPVVVYVLVSALLCALAAWTAPDIIWSQDQGKLLGLASSGNAAGVWVKSGLQGSHTLEYGPLPANLQQIALAVGGDLLTSARLYNVVYFGVLAAGVFGLMRLLALPLGYALVFAATPVLWNLGRDMWDNTVLFPTTLLAVVCYGHFLKTGGHGWLVGTIVCCGLALLTHLMAIPVAAALGLHGVFRNGRLLLRAWVPVVITVVGVTAYGTPYALRQLDTVVNRIRTGHVPMPLSAFPDDPVRNVPHLVDFPTDRPVTPPYPGRLSRASAMAFGLLGGQSFTGKAMLFPQPARPAWLDSAARGAGWFSWVAVPVSLLGIGLMIRMVWKAGDRASARHAVMVTLLITLAVFVVMTAAVKPSPSLHYYHGTIVVFFVAVAVGLQALQRYRIGHTVAAVLVVCLAVQSVQQVTTTVQHATEISTLRAIDAAARPMAAYAPEFIDTPSEVLALYPQALTAAVGYYQHQAGVTPMPVPVVRVVPDGPVFAFSVGELPSGTAYRIRTDRAPRFVNGRMVAATQKTPATQAS